jgi:hypothetical protein
MVAVLVASFVAVSLVWLTRTGGPGACDLPEAKWFWPAGPLQSYRPRADNCRAGLVGLFEETHSTLHQPAAPEWSSSRLDMPVEYSGIWTSISASARAGLFDVSHMGDAPAAATRSPSSSG